MDNLETQVTSVPARAVALQIQTATDYLAAGELLSAIKGLRAEIDRSFDPIIAKAFAAHREAIAQKKKVEAPLAEAEAILKPRIAAYLEAEEQKRQLEELRLQRLAQEAEEQRQLEMAAMLEEAGETEEANRMLEEPVVAAPVIVQRTVPQVQGVVMQKRWNAEVVSLMELVRAVAAGKAPLQCLQADSVFLNRQAVAMRNALNYPGVRAVSQSIVAGRRG
ncbi:MAG TPA: hypothetical protein VIY07_16795 [Pseudolabrys sp.]